MAKDMDRRKFLVGGLAAGAVTLGALILPDKDIFADLENQWQITVDGKIIQTGAFIPGAKKDLYLPVPNGTAHVILDGTRIYMHEDNTICEKKICSLMGSITQPGESITCLPNKLVVRVM